MTFQTLSSFQLCFSELATVYFNVGGSEPHLALGVKSGLIHSLLHLADISLVNVKLLSAQDRVGSYAEFQCPGHNIFLVAAQDPIHSDF